MNIGEFAALLAAFLWAASSLLYSRVSLPASSLNLVKNVLASCMMLAHVLVLCIYRNVAIWQATGWDWQQAADQFVPIFQATGVQWLWLSLSALIGIAIGDTLYFRSLQIMGPRKALMLATFSPAFATVFGVIFLGEVLSWPFIAGTILTTGGVLIVLRDRKAKSDADVLYPGTIRAGICFGLLSAACQALGAVCAKKGLDGIDSEEGALIRVFAAAVMAFFYVAARKQIKQVWKAVRKPAVLRKIIPATVMGTWLGIWLCQVAYKNCPISVSTVLLATTPLFAIPLTRIVYGIPITRTAITGALIAVAGVYLVVSGNYTENVDPREKGIPSRFMETEPLENE